MGLFNLGTNFGSHSHFELGRANRPQAGADVSDWVSQ